MKRCRKYGGPSLSDLRDFNKARAISRELEIPFEKMEDLGHLIDKVFEAKVEPHLVQPVFITDYPIELSPLAKKKEGKTLC